MSEDRAFTPSNIPTKKADYHGSCRFARTSPDISDKEISAINLEFTFEEAMRLSLSVQAALLSLNRYKRSDKVGREMGLCLTVYPDAKNVVVSEYRVRPRDDMANRDD